MTSAATQESKMVSAGSHTALAGSILPSQGNAEQDFDKLLIKLNQTPELTRIAAFSEKLLSNIN